MIIASHEMLAGPSTTRTRGLDGRLLDRHHSQRMAAAREKDMNQREWKPGASIDDLVDLVCSQLGSARTSLRDGANPTRDELAQLVNAAFWASLHTEEGRQVRSRLLFNPDRGAFIVPFTAPCPISTKDLVRLSTTGDPGRGDIVVERRDAQLRITGFCNPEIVRPGMRHQLSGWGGSIDKDAPLRIAILGPGYLRISGSGALFCVEFCRGELRHSRHLHALPFVFEWYEEAAQSFGHPESSQEVEELRSAVRFSWASILRLVARGRHGGCFVVLPDALLAQPLPIKQNYRLDSPCLRDALRDAVDAHVKFERELQAEPRLAELTPAVRFNLPRVTDFVAGLAAVDGAVLIRRDLLLVGFGAELRALESREHTVLEFVGATEPPSLRSLESFGMRHRSAAYLCNELPGATAFVVSQDGHISVFRRGDSHTERHLVTNTAEWLGTEE